MEHKTFKEWFSTTINDTQYLGMDLSKMAWEYQQEEIDQLKNALKASINIIEGCDILDDEEDIETLEYMKDLCKKIPIVTREN